MSQESTAKAHESAGIGSRHCCDAVQAAFTAFGSDVQRDVGTNWCRFDGPGGSVAYVHHKKRLSNVTAYVKHRIGEGQVLAAALGEHGLAMQRRPASALDNGWSATTSVYADITGPDSALGLCRGIAQYWGWAALGDPLMIPEEVADPGVFTEGATTRIAVNKFERNPEARDACIAHYGARCVVCRMDFRSVYGPLGEGYIHVHHLIPLKTVREEYVVDPVRDLRPVCANCHAMAHREDPPVELDRLRRIFEAIRNPVA